MSEITPTLPIKETQQKTPVKPEQPTQEKPPYIPPQQETFAQAMLKGTVEAGATLGVAIVTPVETPVRPVRVFKGEQPNEISEAARRALSEKTGEQIQEKRSEKAAAPIRARAKKPTGNRERESAAQLQAVRSQLQKAA